MRFATKLILLTLSTLTLILVTKSQRTIPSQGEKYELEKLLNNINKPAVKSFQSKYGYILDCIDIKNQLAFDHPLLKNHSIQLKPTTIPKWTKDNNNTSQKSNSLPFQQDDEISCPLGTVITKRTTIEDLIHNQRFKSLGYNFGTSKNKYGDLTGHHFGIAEYFEDNYGAMGNINIWDPPVTSDQSSVASISVSYGLKDQLQSISAGWMASPILNQNHSSLFTYWTASGYNETGCFNTLCPGFVQVSRMIALGAIVKPVSIYGGPQYFLDVKIYQDSGHWWFVLNGEPIGYWPKSLFHNEGLAIGASSYVFWGGEVFSLVRQRITPSMGSGHFPQEGFKKAAFVSGLKIIDNSNKIKIPPASDLIIFANTPNCYNAQIKSGAGDFWSRAVFFGGPGGCTIQ